MTSPAIDATAVASRYRQIVERLGAAARRCGRDPAEITLVAVTKAFGPAAVRAVLAAGAHDIGENYVQEAATKKAALSAGTEGTTTSRMRWHFIGHLQRNKAHLAAALFDVIQTIDGEALAQRLERAAAARGRQIPVLVEVNVGGDPRKSGMAPEGVPGLVSIVAGLPHLQPIGLMTVPPMPEPSSRITLPAAPSSVPSATSPAASFAGEHAGVPAEGHGAVRAHFRALAALRADLMARGFDLPHLSMGMTDDFEIAIEEGATIVRIGRGIFGPRPATK